jgi:hypothetical protein
LLSEEFLVEADDCESWAGDEVRPFCCAPGGMFGGGGGSFCRREVVLKGRIEAMRLVRMKEVRRDIMVIVCVSFWRDVEELGRNIASGERCRVKS